MAANGQKPNGTSNGNGNNDHPSMTKEPIIEDELADKDAGLLGMFSKIFGKKKSSYTMRNKELSLREDALDREATLMNVLKSVTANKSETDLVNAGHKTSTSSGFSFFGMRSKSKENVLEANDSEKTEVKKLPTLEDKTIDKNKKYPPMENLTNAGKKSSSRSGLARLRRIKDEMFKRKHQTLKEDESKENTTEEEGGKKDEENKEETDGAKGGDDEINFEEKKNDNNSDESTTQSSTEATSETASSSEAEKPEVERKQSNSSRTEVDILLITIFSE